MNIDPVLSVFFLFLVFLFFFKLNIKSLIILKPISMLSDISHNYDCLRILGYVQSVIVCIRNSFIVDKIENHNYDLFRCYDLLTTNYVYYFLKCGKIQAELNVKSVLISNYSNCLMERKDWLKCSNSH